MRLSPWAERTSAAAAHLARYYTRHILHRLALQWRPECRTLNICDAGRINQGQQRALAEPKESPAGSKHRNQPRRVNHEARCQTKSPTCLYTLPSSLPSEGQALCRPCAPGTTDGRQMNVRFEGCHDQLPDRKMDEREWERRKAWHYPCKPCVRAGGRIVCGGRSRDACGQG